MMPPRIPAAGFCAAMCPCEAKIYSGVTSVKDIRKEIGYLLPSLLS